MGTTPCCTRAACPSLGTGQSSTHPPPPTANDLQQRRDRQLSGRALQAVHMHGTHTPAQGTRSAHEVEQQLQACTASVHKHATEIARCTHTNAPRPSLYKPAHTTHMHALTPKAPTHQSPLQTPTRTSASLSRMEQRPAACGGCAAPQHAGRCTRQ
jgi:hypothetical protein